MVDLRIDTPEWFEPWLAPATYKGARSGRCGGKSHAAAEQIIEEHVFDQNRRTICGREVQKSIKRSLHQLLVDKIKKFNVSHYFDITNTHIKSRRGDGFIDFIGLQDHTVDSVKSFEGADCGLLDESQCISARSWKLFTPTIIRKEGAEVRCLWNPEEPTNPVDAFFRNENPHPDSICVETSYLKNPWCIEKTIKEAEYARSRNYEDYEHIWLGGYVNSSEARVFKNWTVEEFEAPDDIVFRCGADWGFAVDPTVLIRTFIIGRKLYIDYEAYEIGCEIRNTKDLFMQVPGAETWPIIADGARPETISHLRNEGFKIYGAAKGPGSIKDGIEFLKNYDIIVHPRCVHTIDELKSYKYKVDKDTEQVLSILVDKKNHVIDALRYACENVRKAQAKKIKIPSNVDHGVISHW